MQDFEKIVRELVAKGTVDKASLTEADLAFLSARQAYLSPEEKKHFLSEQPKADPGVPETSMAELKARAKALGIKFRVGQKKVDFQKAIEEAEAKI